MSSVTTKNKSLKKLISQKSVKIESSNQPSETPLLNIQIEETEISEESEELSVE